MHLHAAKRHSPAALVAFYLADGDIAIVIAPGGGDAGDAAANADAGELATTSAADACSMVAARSLDRASRDADGEGFMSVTATKSDDSYMPIGLSDGDGDDNTDTCGVITFGNTVIYDGGDEKNYNVEEVDGLYFSEGNDGKTWTLTPD